jgi:hypothetical protein
MTWNLSRLRGLDPKSEEFEVERRRLIKAEIEKVPAEQRGKLLVLQNDLDRLRSELSPDQFMEAIVYRLREQIECLEDVAQYLKNTQVKKTR